MKNSHGKYMYIFLIQVGLFVQLVFCSLEISFLESCSNSQLRPVPCPMNETYELKEQNQARKQNMPTFVIGSIWENHRYVLYGNFVIYHQPGGSRRMVEMILSVREDIVDRKCLDVLQSLEQEIFEINCLKMVPDNFAKLNVRLMTSIGGQKSDGSKRRDSGASIHQAVFNIGQESCTYYNSKIDKIDHFTVWKTGKLGQLAFHYTDTSMNMFAIESEVLITEVCTDRFDVVFNKTLHSGTPRTDLNATFQTTCPWSKVLELIIESCSFCYRSHEDGACFDRTIDLRSTALETRYPCDRCDKHASCQDKYCVCRPGYTGDGSQCWPIGNEGQNNVEVLMGCMCGIILISTMIGMVMWHLHKEKWKKRDKEERSYIKVQYQNYNNVKANFSLEKEEAPSLNEQVSTLPCPDGVLILYHPDNLTHQHCINNFFQQLIDQKIRVHGLPEDYYENWIKIADEVDHLFSDVVFILSLGLSELLRLSKKQASRNSDEETRWNLLLQARFYENVPGRVINIIDRLVKNGSKPIPKLHLISFHDNNTDISKRKITQQAGSFFVNDYGADFCVKHHQIRVSKSWCNTSDVRSMADTFKSCRE